MLSLSTQLWMRHELPLKGRTTQSYWTRQLRWISRLFGHRPKLKVGEGEHQQREGLGADQEAQRRMEELSEVVEFGPEVQLHSRELKVIRAKVSRHRKENGWESITTKTKSRRVHKRTCRRVRFIKNGMLFV